MILTQAVGRPRKIGPARATPICRFPPDQGFALGLALPWSRGSCCWRNWRAFLVFILGWASVAMFFSLIVTLVAVATDSVDTAKLLLMPMMLLMAAMFFCSIYFSFRDCFEAEEVVA